MEKILTQAKAREVAKDLSAKLSQDQREQSETFKQLVDEINTTPLDGAGMEEIGALLALSEPQFAMIAPAFLDEMEKSYNDINTQLLLVQSMNAAGKKFEDIEAEYIALCDVMDEQIGNSLSAQKRDFLKRLIGITYNALAGTEGIAKKTINIPIEYCHTDAKMPAYAHPSDAGMDVYALEDITIAPGETKLIPIGIKVAIPLGYELQVRPKSGRCLKTKLRVANAPGTIDAGYRDEIGVIIDNIDPPIRSIHFDNEGLVSLGSIEYGQSYTIGKGEKFAQLVLSEVPKVAWVEVESVTDDGNRGGGFGSSSIYSENDPRYMTDVK